MSGIRYSPEFRAEALRLYSSGKSSELVAEIMGCTTGIVCAWARSAGIPAHRRGKKPGPPAPVSPPQPTPDELAMREAVERYVAGESSELLADELGLNSQRILRRVRREGHRVRTAGQSQSLDAKLTAAERDAQDEAFGPSLKRYAGDVTPSQVTVTLDLVDDGMGTTRLVARRWRRAEGLSERGTRDRRAIDPDDDESVSAVHRRSEYVVLAAHPNELQASWDPAALNEWVLGVLHLFAPVQPRQGVHVAR